MQPTFDEIGIELLNRGYRRVVFLEVECKIDGTYRLGVSAELQLGSHFDCPKCHMQRPCSGILAIGYSKNLLEPEFWCGAAKWHQISEDEYRHSAPKPGMDGRPRHYRKTLAVDVQKAEEMCATV